MVSKRKVFVAALACLVSAAALHADTIYVSTGGGDIDAIASDGAVSIFVSGKQLDPFSPPHSYGYLFGAPLAFNGAGSLYASGELLVMDGSAWGAGPGFFEITPDGTVALAPASIGFAAGWSSGVAFDAVGDIFVTEAHDNRISEVTPGGTVTTFTSVTSPHRLAFGPGSSLYVSDSNDATITQLGPTGTIITSFSSGLSNAPTGLAFDASGNLYVADGIANINKITSAGDVSTFATGLAGPCGLAFGSNGDLYVADSLDGTIDEFSPEGLNIATIASGLSSPQYIAIQAPEPSSLALLSLCAFALLGRRRRR
jgi:streptogramin lyase